MSQTRTAPQPRQSQAERTDAMRTRLLEATLQVIAEEGWAQASTQKICKRAGVSRGAQTHHFPSKNSLLLAAVREIITQYQSDMDAALDETSDDGLTLSEFFDFLWDACFDGDLLTCWLDAMNAARTDTLLREEVRDTDSKSLTAIGHLGLSTVRLEANPPSWSDRADEVIELTVYLLRGFVLQDGVHQNAAKRRKLFDLWKQLVL